MLFACVARATHCCLHVWPCMCLPSCSGAALSPADAVARLSDQTDIIAACNSVQDAIDHATAQLGAQHTDTLINCPPTQQIKTKKKRKKVIAALLLRCLVPIRFYCSLPPLPPVLVSPLAASGGGAGPALPPGLVSPLAASGGLAGVA